MHKLRFEPCWSHCFLDLNENIWVVVGGDELNRRYTWDFIQHYLPLLLSTFSHLQIGTNRSHRCPLRRYIRARRSPRYLCQGSLRRGTTQTMQKDPMESSWRISRHSICRIQPPEKHEAGEEASWKSSTWNNHLPFLLHRRHDPKYNHNCGSPRTITRMCSFYGRSLDQQRTSSQHTPPRSVHNCLQSNHFDVHPHTAIPTSRKSRLDCYPRYRRSRLHNPRFGDYWSRNRKPLVNHSRKFPNPSWFTNRDIVQKELYEFSKLYFLWKQS